MSYVEERPWWPIQSPDKGRKTKKRKAKRRGRSDQVIDVIFQRWHVVGFRKEGGGKKFHKFHVLGMNGDLWDRVCGLGSESWKGCE